MNPPAMHSRPRSGWGALALLPFAALAVLVARYGVDAPLIDQWSMVHDFQKFFDGDWGPLDWIRSHNGHRILLPRLLLVPLGALTGWNVRVEMALGIACGVGIFWLLWAAARSVLETAGAARDRWLMPAFSVLVFSLNQWENWLWGLQMHVFLAVLLALATFRLLGADRPGWRPLGAASLCGVAATFTQGTGLVVWPVGLAMLAVRTVPGWSRRARALSSLLWAGLAAGVFAVYLHPFPGDSANAPSLLEALRRPADYLDYVLTQLGAPLVSFAGSSWPPRDHGAGGVVGAAGLGLLGVAIGVLLRRRAAVWPQLLPLLAGALFSVGVAAQIGLGRIGLGVAQAMASRYVTLTVPFWAAVLVCVALAARQLEGRLRDLPLARFLRGAAWAIVALALVSSYHALPIYPARYELLSPARAEMVRGELDVFLERLHGEVQQVRGGLGVLRRHRLSVFREGEIAPPPPARPEPLTSFGQILALRGELADFETGATQMLRVAVTNPSSVAWPARGVAAGTYSVRLGYHWFDTRGRIVVFEGRRTALPRDLAPGETVELDAAIDAPAEPGRYLLRLTMVQEGVAWFDAAGTPPADLEVEVLR